MNDKVNSYQKVDTMGKSQLELIIKVYDGALAEFKKAKAAIGDEKFDDGVKFLEKGQKFVTHLYTTLDMEKGGDISLQLSKLYVFILNQINIITATKDIAQIDDIIHILENLRAGWSGLEDQPQPKETPNASEPVNAGGFTVSG